MLRYTIRRLIALIPVMFGVALLIFTILFFTPGDPADLILGNLASEEQKTAWRDANGLNSSYFAQFGTFIFNLVISGDLGTSFQSGRSVTDTIMQRLPTTFLLAVTTTAVASVVGILLGVVAAKYHNTWIDMIVRVFGMAGISMPVFWFGLLLIILFAVQLRWLPVSGWYGPKYWILPTIALGLGSASIILRVTRSSILDCIRQDYVRTVRAKGQTERKIMRHHILRNALIPIITVVGGCFGAALGGAMILEQVFSINGLGRLMVNAIDTRDYPLVRAAVLVLAMGFCLVYLIIDLLYAYVDPRIRFEFSAKGG